ncbi:MAG: endonuclease/exonuclease/phosphatase family protein [Alphaproteobacteria bacterium]
MKALKTLLACGVAVLMLFSLMPYMPALSFQLIDLPSHFVVQYALAVAVLLPATGFLKMPKTAVTLLCVLLLNFWQLYPQLMPMPAPATTGKPLKILQANTLYFTKNFDAFKALVAAEKPDLIVGSETNHELGQVLKTLEKDYPHQAVHTQGDNPRGLALLSKIPFTRQDKAYYDHAKIPSQVFTIEHEGQKIRFVSVHPSTPMTVEGLESRDNIFKNLFKKMEKENPDNLVVLGDFNATPWCPALKKLTVDLDLTNSRNGKGLMPTWHTAFPGALFRIPIDHVLVSKKLAAVTHRLGPEIGSDHLPSIVEIAFKK